MGRGQIESDFSRLYIGQNSRLLVEKYYKEKKKQMIRIFLAGVFFLGVLLFREIKAMELPGENTLYRNAYGEGEKEFILEVRQGTGEWRPLTVTVEEKSYTEEELETYSSQLMELLPELILKENEGVDHVCTDLELMEEVEGYPFWLQWTSSDTSRISSSGMVNPEGAGEEGCPVELTVTLQYEEWKEVFQFFVRVEEPFMRENLSIIQKITEEIQQTEKNSRSHEAVILPASWEGMNLDWRYPMKKESLVLGFFLPVIMLIIWREKDREVAKEAAKRREALQNRYPELVGKLILFMEAGMPIKTALFRMVTDYRNRKRNEPYRDYLYEELQYICFQMQNGMSELQGYELLGVRCELPVYRKLSALLQSHTQKGAGGILLSLRQESIKANEERKNQVKRKGEEAGTKLLFPMIILLGIVMVLILVPAMFSFQL